MSDHVGSISEYIRNALVNGEQYIIPPMTLNATKGLKVFVGEGMVMGWAVLPEEQVLNITDGMHRFLATPDVLQKTQGAAQCENFMNDCVPVRITVEADTNQVHQGFADAGKTKALPPSLMAIFDVRQPGNQVVHQLIDRVPVLTDRVDASAATLSKNSPYMFLVNQVRQFVKSSISGTPALSDPVFAKTSATVLTNGGAFESFIASRAIFLRVASEIIPEWKRIAALPVPTGPRGTETLAEMKIIREKGAVSLTASFLNTLGMVSNTVLGRIGDFEPEALEYQLEDQLRPLRE